MQINRATADGTAPWQGYFCSTEVCQQRPKYQNRGAHGFYQLVGRAQVGNGTRVELNAQLFINSQIHSHAAQKLQHGGNIMQMGQIAYSDRLIRQQGRGQDRQCRVFGAGDTDLSIEAGTAFDNQFVHRYSCWKLSSVRPIVPGYRS